MTPETLMEMKSWAVIGVKPDQDQYAHMIYMILKEHGYQAYAVNPRFDRIGDDVCYASVADIPGRVDVADMVVNPSVGLRLLDEIAAKGIKYLWLQPGSHDEALTEKADVLGFEYVKDCILARLRLKAR